MLSRIRKTARKSTRPIGIPAINLPQDMKKVAVVATLLTGIWKHNSVTGMIYGSRMQPSATCKTNSRNEI
jgi:hypothetical protein